MKRKIAFTGLGKTEVRESEIRAEDHFKAQLIHKAKVIPNKNPRKNIPRNTKHKINLTREYR